MWDLIVSVPDHCISFYFSKITKGPVIIYQLVGGGMGSGQF